MKNFGTVKFFALLGLIFLPLHTAFAGDDFETFRRQQMQGAQQVKSEFHQYKEKQDREFAGFLKEQWAQFDTFQGKVRLKEPEPKLAPIAPPPPGAKPVVVAPVIIPPAPPAPPPQAKPVTLVSDEIELAFFGNAVKFPLDPQWKSYRLGGNAKPETMGDLVLYSHF